ncbi:transposase [Mycobacterium sp. 852002-51057_SCH5723018]|nr:transposase [Mycobacterium sp. 852002-51057_SCH5723018]
MSRARTQAERTRATTDQLVAAGRELFANNGYDPTFLDAVVERARVTKGALYHHFDGKRALFAAVYEAEQRSIARAVNVAAGKEDNSWKAFLAGCQAFFDAATDSGFQQILIDAPAVLGWKDMRDIEDRHLMAMIKQGLSQAMDGGHIKRRRVDPLAHQVHGAMCEAAMVIARSDDPEHEAHEAMSALTELLNGLVSPPKARGRASKPTRSSRSRIRASSER